MASASVTEITVRELKSREWDNLTISRLDYISLRNLDEWSVRVSIIENPNRELGDGYEILQVFLTEENVLAAYRKHGLACVTSISHYAFICSDVPILGSGMHRGLMLYIIRNGCLPKGMLMNIWTPGIID